MNMMCKYNGRERIKRTLFKYLVNYGGNGHEEDTSDVLADCLIRFLCVILLILRFIMGKDTPLCSLVYFDLFADM